MNTKTKRDIDKELSQARDTIAALNIALPKLEVQVATSKAAWEKDRDHYWNARFREAVQRSLDAFVVAADLQSEVEDLWYEAEAAGAKLAHAPLHLPELVYEFEAPVVGGHTIVRQTSAFGRILDAAKSLSYTVPDAFDNNRGFQADFGARDTQSAAYTVGAMNGAAAAEAALQPIRDAGRRAIATASNLLARFGYTSI